MNKHLLLILLGFGSFGVFASWQFQENNDPIDGKTLLVFSESMNSQGGLQFRSDSISLYNGDNYICPSYISSPKQISVFFKIDSDPHFEHDMAISANSKWLVYREDLRGSGITFKKMNDYTRTLSNKGPYFVNKGFDLKKLAARLKKADKLFIRTIDGCGKQIDLNFDMNGFAEQITKIPSFLDG